VIVTVYLPLIAVLVLAVLAPTVGHGLTPAVATRLLSVVAAAAAAATVAALVLLAIGGLLRGLALAGAITDPSRAHAEAAADSVRWPWGVAALVLLGVAAVRAMRVIRGERAALRGLRHVVAGHDEELLVVSDARPYAYAVPCGPGTIIVSTAMLSALDPAERRAMLAHERAHLSHRHHRFRLIARLAAGVNPALARLDRHIGFQIERWADEHAATSTSRPVAARSLARAALAASPRTCGALGFTEHAVTARVTALTTDPRPTRWVLVAPIVAMTATMLGCLADSGGACWRLIEILHP
jgi:hypothetical protein